jgi:NAD(P)-dependent dehydrogenase (short-subunit alcohol dehydrogenase family)
MARREEHREGPVPSLAGKVAVITGAAAGIGRATATAFGREGAVTVLADIDDGGGRAACEELVAQGNEAQFVHADVGRSADVDALMRFAAERHGRLDVLVNNAGISVPGDAISVSDDDWARALNVNLTGVWRGMRSALPLMIDAGGGSIVNVASVQAMVGVSGWAAYAASKGGVVALTRQAAVEFAPQSIRINAVAPGTILTPMNERILEQAASPADLRRSWEASHPLGRLGSAAEVAEAIAFLSSDRAAFITGECLRVDGGLVISSSAGGLE